MTFFIKKYIFNLWRELIGSFVLVFLQAISLIPVALLTRQLFDQILPQKDTSALFTTLGLIFCLLTINAVVAIANRYLVLRMVKSSVGQMRNDLLENLLTMSLLESSRQNVDLLHSQVVHDSERVDKMISSLLSQFLPSLLVVAGLSIVLWYLSPTLALSAGIVVPLLLLVGKWIGNRAEAWTRAFHKDFAQFSEGILFVLGFGELIKHSSAEDYEFERQKNHIANLRDSSHRMAWLTTAYTITQSNVVLVGGIIVLLVGGTQVIGGGLSLGSLLSFYVALSFLTSHLRLVTSSIATMIEGQASLVTLHPFLNRHPRPTGGNPFPGLGHHISLENLKFSHSSDFGLTDISFRINKGELVGLYGASGAGKSTLVNLILGLYTPDEGAVKVDGVEVATFDGPSYRQRIGVVSQQAFIFDGSIADNIRYGLENVSAEDLISASRASQADDFIQDLAQGYDTTVGARGVRLSGGQRQRLAIARALLRRPDLLILDEPDNNLDLETVSQIISNIQAIGITTLLITHRPELRSVCTAVYKLVDGKIIAITD